MGKERKSFGAYTHSEVKTAGGQLIEFSCAPEDVTKIKEIFGSVVKDIDVPRTREINSVGQGGYGRRTRFKIKQHNYAGGGYPGCGGFIEVLEITDPIDGKKGNILHEYRTQEYSVICYFIEWETIADATNAFKKHWNGLNSSEFSTLPGFLRRVECGRLTPWFYAISDQDIIGDYAFPENLQDDPIYTFGRKFVVYIDSHKDEKKPIIKTCMGCRIVDRNGGEPYRIIYWSDGTTWSERDYRRGKNPRPIEEADDEDLWAHEIRRQLPFLKKGKRMAIYFANGLTFVGAFTKNEKPTPAGSYYVSVTLKGRGVDQTDDPPIEGWLDFVPNEKFPTLAKQVLAMFSKHKIVVSSIRIEKKKNAQGKGPNLFFTLENSKQCRGINR
ncbi:MAG: hypothetical protein WC470_00885 [Candidatus Paceibacterota bacterium]